MATAKLILEGKEHELPVYIGTENEVGIDITELRNKTGAITLDSGYANTGACFSNITYIDGEKGILRYRGYPVDQLAEHAKFTEVAHLLMYGELPSLQQLLKFREELTYHSMLHEDMNKFFEGFPRGAHPMAILSAMVASLSTYYPESDERRDMIRLLAKAKTIAAFAYKKSVGQPFMYPRNELSYCGNILHMMFGVPCEAYHVDPVLEDAMHVLLILHADHEQNASTSTVRLAGSSGANPFACVSAGIASLWGPAHGGANEATLKMLEEIGDVSRIGEYIKRAKDKSDPFRLMGFGHRVYRNMDPRASIMRETCHQVLEELGLTNDPMFKLALELEKIALEDEYFVSKRLYPNVDFYSGIVMRAMGIPNSMFTAIFAMARTAGWVAQWNEMISDPESKIGRPRQLYTGEARREFVPIKQR